MNLGFNFLSDLLKKKEFSQKDLATQLNITPQSITKWQISNSVPSKRVLEIADLFDLNDADLDRLLGIEPLEIFFRNKNGQELTTDQVPPLTRARAELIYDRFLSSNLTSQSNDSLAYINKVRDKIKETGPDFRAIAQSIREVFEVPSYSPLSKDNLRILLDRISVDSYYLPFKSLKLISDNFDEIKKTAILFTRNERYSILVDSDRNIDEAHFDTLHELIHIFFQGVFTRGKKTEDLIDLVVGDLIYPKSYMIRVFFSGCEVSRPGFHPDNLKDLFVTEFESSRFILSPKGLARALRDSGLTSNRSKLYSFLYKDLHDKFRDIRSITYSRLGGMDFDFSDRAAIEAFYVRIETPENRGFFPLFSNIKKDLLNSKISPLDFSEIFGLQPSDGIVLKAIWQND